ncbi:MAG: hypothetical protein ACLP9L_11850 [Thermoguttaceae bacterium]
MRIANDAFQRSPREHSVISAAPSYLTRQFGPTFRVAIQWGLGLS